jgi:hypothetical protein
MAFPFFPAGAITATFVLGGIIVLFRMLLLALDRGAAELRGSIGPGLVRGVRAWARESGDPAAATTAAARWPRRKPRAPDDPAHAWSLPAGVILEDLIDSPEVDLEAVRPHA